MKLMAAERQLVHVTLSGDINGEYVVKDEGPDGEITLVPDTSAEAILDRLGHTQATLADFEAEYGAVLPPARHTHGGGAGRERSRGGHDAFKLPVARACASVSIIGKLNFS